MREWRWVLLSVVLLALLVWLAVLQYQGIASITDAERARLRASAQARATEMARAFDNEIARTYAAFYRPLGFGSADPATTEAQMLAKFRATSRYSRLVRDVLMLTFGPEGSVLRRVVPEGPAQPIEWPQEFARWIPRLKMAMPGLQSSSSAGSSGSTGFLLADVPAFLAPMTNISMAPTASPKQTPMSASVSFSGIVLVWLDRHYLEKEFLPALVARHFSSRDGYDYHVAVVAAKEGNRFVYVSDTAIPRSAFSTPDVHATLFQVRLDLLMQAAVGTSAAALAIRSDPEAGEWQLRLVHRAGSLNRAVGAVRLRNLGVSFGAMLLVAVSTGFLVFSTRRAQRLARQQMVFVAGVSHELRTPLTVIRSAGENLSDGVISDPAQVRHYGEVIADEGQRLTEMVEQVMAFAGFESGRDLSERTAISVAELIDNAVERSRVEDAGCTLERKVPADLPVVQVNVSAMLQAIENLLGNAAKYGGDDRWARIAAERSTDGRELRIIVSDHGRGVRPDEQRRIFEPFYRSRDVVGTTIRGAGLGLSLAKRIVEAHGGTITVRSARGQGTTFTVHLPIEQVSPKVRESESPKV